jgi:poly(A) polymerase
MQERGIVGPVLAEAHRLGLLEHLLPEVTEVEGMFPLLEILDERAAAGRVPPEWCYVAALVLPTVARRYPITPGANLESAQEAIAGPVEGLTGRYQISAHIRHQARDILLSCYRIARGKAYRAKGKFARKPEFKDAWTFVESWARVAGGLETVVAYWDSYLKGEPTPKTGEAEGGRRRRPRRRRRKPPKPAPAE